MRAIGIAGTAKNTGKTTCMIALLAELRSGGVPTGITSIGYDGEEFDHLIGLPKPRVIVAEGILVATAEATLRGATAPLERVGSTGVQTVLGEVILVRATGPGALPLAGPPSRAGLASVLKAMAEAGVEVCLVDGAFGRMAPMAGLDGLILATGAARSRDPQRLVAECLALAAIFALPLAPAPPPASGPDQVALAPQRVSNLLTALSIAAALDGLPPGSSLLVEGALSIAALERLADWPGWGEKSACTFADPIGLVLAGDLPDVHRSLIRLAARCRVGVLQRLPLPACTYNPFYPFGLPGGGFASRFLEEDVLQMLTVAGMKVPVVDVQRDGVGAILERVAKSGHG